MHQYITSIVDTDKYLCTFLNVKDLLIFGKVSHAINNLIREITFVKQFLNFRNYEGWYRLVDFVCANNYIELLDQLYSSSNNFEYTLDTIIWAAQNGHMRILEWFQNKKLDYQYNSRNILIMYCLREKHLDILDWLNANKKIDESSIPYYKSCIAYKYGLPECDNFEIKNTIHVEILMACIFGKIKVLDILNKDKNLKKHFDDKNLNLIRIIMMNNYYRTLKWIRANYDSCLCENVDDHILFLIHHNKYIIIKWFMDHKYKINNIDNLIKMASKKHCVKIVNLLVSNQTNIE